MIICALIEGGGVGKQTLIDKKHGTLFGICQPEEDLILIDLETILSSPQSHGPSQLKEILPNDIKLSTGLQE